MATALCRSLRHWGNGLGYLLESQNCSTTSWLNCKRLEWMGKLKIPVRPKCIFCEQPNKVSYEHLFPRWLKKEFPNSRGDTWINSSWRLPNNIADNTIIDFSDKTKPGSTLDFKIRGVCVPCNNGWMSKIEEECKPIIRSLMGGEPLKISCAAQEKLARWAVLKTMVYDASSYEIGLAISQADRNEFLESRTLPASWRIRIAWSADPEVGQCTSNKVFCWHEEMDGPAVETHDVRPPNTIVIQLILGNLTVIVIASESKMVQELYLPLHLRAVIRQIHPSDGYDFSWPPIRRLTDHESEGLVNWSRNVRFLGD